MTLSIAIAAGVFLGGMAIIGTVYFGQQVLECRRLAAVQQQRDEASHMCDEFVGAASRAAAELGAATDTVNSVRSEWSASLNVPGAKGEAVNAKYDAEWAKVSERATQSSGAADKAEEDLSQCSQNQSAAINALLKDN